MTIAPEAVIFQARTVHAALRKLGKYGYRALFAPEYADRRIAQAHIYEDSEFWGASVTLSGIYFGKTRRGNKLAAITHGQHYLSNPDNIETAVNAGLNEGGAVETEEIAGEFERLVALEDGRNIFVIEHKDWNKSKMRVRTVDEALENPVAVAFFGGMDRTAKYFGAHNLAAKKEGRYLLVLRGYEEIRKRPTARLLEYGGYSVYTDRHFGHADFVAVAKEDAGFPMPEESANSERPAQPLAV